MQPRLMAPENPSPRAIAPPIPWYQRPSLDRASQAYINELMYGEYARTLFRDQGEDAYVDHINQGLLNASRLARFALPQEGIGVNQAGAPAEPSMAAPARSAADNINAGTTTQPRIRDIPDVRPPIVPPRRADADRQERERRLDEATLRYAGLIATRRASHGDALLERQRQRGRVGRIVARVLGVVLNPAEIGDYRHAEQLAQRSAQAANEYRRRVNEYVTAEAQSHDQGVSARLNLMNRFEVAVDSQSIEQTSPHQHQDGTRYRSRWDDVRVRLARAWFNSNRVERAVIVAPGAAAVGLVIGVAVGVASWPIVVLGLGGALLAGRSIGGAITGTVNRFQAAHQPTRELHNQQSLSRNRIYANYLRTHLTPAEQQLDLTRVYESATLARAQENLHRKRRAELVGAVAAGAAFGVGWGASHLELAINQGAQVKPTPTPTHTTPTPNTPPTPTVNVHDYPWNVAHQLQPDHEWNLINSAMQQYNAAHGTHLHLVAHANGTQWTWIENGSKALNPAQQAGFNQFMESIAARTA